MQNLYSTWPLSEYLDQVANWASQHPTEAVVVDLSTICYDHGPSAAIDEGLWANFATKSAEGAGPGTLADVAVDPSSFGGSLASATLGDLTRAGRNVTVLIPASALDSKVLTTTYHVEPVRTAPPKTTSRGSTVVEHSDPMVAPTSPDEFATANASLESFPITSDPRLGSLQGKGVYVSKVAYELKGAPPAAQASIFSAFVGLIASQGIFKAWLLGAGTGPTTRFSPSGGKSTNVVLADGVELGGFIPQVIERNGR